MSSDGGRAAWSLVAVLAGLSVVAAVPTEADPGGDAVYMVPHLGSHAVLGPVTGAPPVRHHATTRPHAPLARVPISSPPLSVRTLDDAEGPSVQRTAPRRRKHKRSPEIIQAFPRGERECYNQCSAMCRRRALRTERFLVPSLLRP